MAVIQTRPILALSEKGNGRTWGDIGAANRMSTDGDLSMTATLQRKKRMKTRMCPRSTVGDPVEVKKVGGIRKGIAYETLVSTKMWSSTMRTMYPLLSCCRDGKRQRYQ